MLKRILLISSLILSLVACDVPSTPSNAGLNDGMASVTVTIEGVTQGSKRSRSAQRVGVPAEVTSIVIEVLDSAKNQLDAAEVIGSSGTVTLSIQAGKNYTLRGSAYAGDELLFLGETNIAELKNGSQSSIALRLDDQVLLALTPLPDTPVGQGQATVNFNLTGINDGKINWYVNDVLGGNNSVGLITNQGLYTPPAILPANVNLVIKAEPIVAPSFAQTFSFSLLPAVINVPPFDVAMSISGYDPNALNPFTLTMTFPTPISGFDSSDIVLTGATVSSLNTNDNTVFNATILPSKTGTVTVTILANSVIDSNGASNNESRQLRVPFFNWALIHPQPTTVDLESIAVGGGRCLLAGAGGNVSEILSSPTDLQWQRFNFKPADASFTLVHDVTYTTLNGGFYLATAKDGFYSSTDAQNWVFKANNNGQTGLEYYAIAEGVDSNSQPLLVAVAKSNNQLSRSTDGVNWDPIDFNGILQANEFIDLYDVIWDYSQFVAVGSRFQFNSFSNSNKGSIILTSTDGINWAVAYSSSVSTGGFSNVVADFLLTVAVAPDGLDGLRWFAMGNKGLTVYSEDGVNWSQSNITLGDSVRIESIAFSGNSVVAVGSDSSGVTPEPVAYQTYPGDINPASNWTKLTLPPGISGSSSLKDIDICRNQLTNNKVWLAVGDKGLVISSNNFSGLTWNQVSRRQFSEGITQYSESNALFLSETQNGSIYNLYRSNDGINWTGGFSENIIDLSFNNGTFFAITRDTNIGNWALKTSTDGLSWAERISVPTIFPYPTSLLNITTATGSALWLLGTQNESSIRLSTDGFNWINSNLSTPLQVQPNANSDNNLFISSINNQLVSSDNGTVWNSFGSSFCSANCPFDTVNQVLHFSERYVVRGEVFAGEGSQSKLIYSDDNGQSWSASITLPGSCAPIMSIEADLLTYSCGQLYVSIDAIEWVEVLVPFNKPKLKFTNGNYRLFGDNGSLMHDKPPALNLGPS